MNVKFEKDGITFKISEEELVTLKRGSLLVMELFPGKHISIQFSLVPEGCPEGVQMIMKESSDNNKLTLLVSKEAIDELDQIGRNRDGVSIETETGALIRLQVDIRKDTRRAAG